MSTERPFESADLKNMLKQIFDAGGEEAFAGSLPPDEASEIRHYNKWLIEDILFEINCRIMDRRR